MRRFAWVLTLLLLAVVPAPSHSIDLTRYFPSADSEASSRRALYLSAAALLREPVAATPQMLKKWLSRYSTSLESVRKHDLYVYLRAQRDVDDSKDAKADDDLGSLENLLTGGAEQRISLLGPTKIKRFIEASPSLAKYRYFLTASLRRGGHRLPDKQETAVSQATDPTLTAVSESYRSLRRAALAKVPHSAEANSPAAAFRDRWAPFATNEEAFFSQLLAIASIRNSVARLHGFKDASDSVYFAQVLSRASVERTLAAVRTSTAYRRYQDVLEASASKQLHSTRPLHVWELESADTFTPPTFSFEEAIPLILSSERRVGPAYAAAYADLLDAKNRRVDLCVEPKCASTGFSVGFAGAESGLYFGGYKGTLTNVRAIAHEAGHAVHRQFMNEHQAIAMYHQGPNFMFESFAIFSELLLFDYLYEHASTEPERAYYLNQFVADATFQVFGSAAETDLEAHIYSSVGAGKARSASDLDVLTSSVFARYMPRLAAEDGVKRYWARNSLYFTDPLYDVSYLYAGLLSLRYFTEFKSDPRHFAKSYIALLENGFTDAPDVLERKFLGIDLTDERALVANADKLIQDRTAILAKLYAIRDQ